MPLKEIDNALDPTTTARITGKVAIIAVIVVAGLVSAQMAIRLLYQGQDVVTVNTYDNVWFARTEAEIAALDREIDATSVALTRKQEDIASRWISRSDDRTEFDRLNRQLMALTTRRSELVKEMQVALQIRCGVAAVESE